MLKPDSTYEQMKKNEELQKEEQQDKDETVQKKKEHSLRSKLLYLAVTAGAVFCIIYICFAGYYWDKFLSGTYINGVEVSGMTIKEAEREVKKSEISKIVLLGRNNEKNEINLSELKAKVIVGDKVNKVKSEQNPLLWLSGCLEKEENDVQTTISYSSTNLESYLDALPMLSSSDRVKPQDAKVVYSKDKGYEIQEEVLGNTVDKDKLMDCVVKAIRNHERSVDLEKNDCYVNPKRVVADADFKALDSKLTMLKTIKIEYSDNKLSQSADYSSIKNWINVDSDLNVTIKDDAINDFVTKVAYKFNTVGKIRNFKTASGTTIRIGGGNYGNRIAYEKEFNAVKQAVTEGKSINRAPEYIQKSLVQGSNDIGDTYIEVCISRQTLYYFENGKKVIETPVVTGCVSSGHSTPKGVCCVQQKDRNRILRGPGYASFVKYWIRINGGVGIHDSSWRKAYGGTHYLRGGSHGCINTPYSKVVQLFGKVQMGTPAIVY